MSKEAQGGWKVTEESCVPSGGLLYRDGCALSDQLGRDVVFYDKGVPLYLRVFPSGGIKAAWELLWQISLLLSHW